MLGLVLVLVVPPLFGALALRVSYAGDLREDARTRGKDAIWLGHAWVDGRRKDADLAAFAERIKGTGIRDLYVHAGPLEHDGTLPAARYPRAKWLIDAVHRTMPGIRVQAWLGDILATEGPDGLHLEKAGSRAAVVTSARQILDAGFDGVHFDLEPLLSDDAHYLSLLDDLQEADPVADGAALGRRPPDRPAARPPLGERRGQRQREVVVAGVLRPGGPARRPDRRHVVRHLDAAGEPLRRIRRPADQPRPRSHPRVDRPADGPPFFHEDDLGHHDNAETVDAAVRGTRLGLGRTDPGRQRFGVALYVDFAAKEGDWAAYRAGWH